ncbi:fungal-specific transcription factor domain-containing protein [Aspergillus keveii]|uniref:Fungal-specific transcription factor domain-containing protein n=1 Tax=Aspergillus keveii TaxID=714993 RepID=A0ABR4FSC5_9EURO
MLLAASKVSKSGRLLQLSDSTTTSASGDFYKRAKALYDAGYETDQVAVVQSLILMGWYCEDPRGVGTTFYWTRIAISVAQSIGLHRRVTGSNLPLSKKRLYKRIWWTLFTRDRALSVALGRPSAINILEFDVEPVDETDFFETDDSAAAQYPSNRLHAMFFVQYVELSKIMGRIFSTYYSVSSKVVEGQSDSRQQYDSQLTAWLQQRPPEMVWQNSRHEFWASMLHLHYGVAVCLLDRAHMPAREGTPNNNNNNNNDRSSSNGVPRQAAYNAANCITDIVETLILCDQLNYAPPFIVYCLYSALLVHVYEMRRTSGPASPLVTCRVDICLYALRKLSGSWTVANLIHMVFSFLLKWNPDKNGDPGWVDIQGAFSDIQSGGGFSFPDIDLNLMETGTFDLQAMGLLHSGEGQF